MNSYTQRAKLQELYDKMRLIKPLKNISMIVACDLDGVIGKDGGLPWERLKGDLQRFKEITQNKALIMGRKTFASLPGILEDRPHIVITKNPEHYEPVLGKVRYVASLEAAFEIVECANEEAFVVGGGEIYEQALPYVSKLYLTRVLRFCKGDVRVGALALHSRILELFKHNGVEPVYLDDLVIPDNPEDTRNISHIYKNFIRVS